MLGCSFWKGLVSLPVDWKLCGVWAGRAGEPAAHSDEVGAASEFFSTRVCWRVTKTSPRQKGDVGFPGCGDSSCPDERPSSLLLPHFHLIYLTPASLQSQAQTCPTWHGLPGWEGLRRLSPLGLPAGQRSPSLPGFPASLCFISGFILIIRSCVPGIWRPCSACRQVSFPLVLVSSPSASWQLADHYPWSCAVLQPGGFSGGHSDLIHPQESYSAGMTYQCINELMLHCEVIWVLPHYASQGRNSHFVRQPTVSDRGQCGAGGSRAVWWVTAGTSCGITQLDYHTFRMACIPHSCSSMCVPYRDHPQLLPSASCCPVPGTIAPSWPQLISAGPAVPGCARCLRFV